MHLGFALAADAGWFGGYGKDAGKIELRRGQKRNPSWQVTLCVPEQLIAADGE
jgi:hypothetical protein